TTGVTFPSTEKGPRGLKYPRGPSSAKELLSRASGLILLGDSLGSDVEVGGRPGHKRGNHGNSERNPRDQRVYLSLDQRNDGTGRHSSGGSRGQGLVGGADEAALRGQFHIGWDNHGVYSLGSVLRSVGYLRSVFPHEGDRLGASHPVYVQAVAALQRG